MSSIAEPGRSIAISLVSSLYSVIMLVTSSEILGQFYKSQFQKVRIKRSALQFNPGNLSQGGGDFESSN